MKYLAPIALFVALVAGLYGTAEVGPTPKEAVRAQKDREATHRRVKSGK